MAGRNGSLTPARDRRRAMAWAAGLSLAMHLAIVAALGALARRAPAAPPIEHDETDAVEVSPLEIPVPADMPAWPTAGMPNRTVADDNVVARTAPATQVPAEAPTPARPHPRPKLLAQTSPPEPTPSPPDPEGSTAAPAPPTANPAPHVTPAPREPSPAEAAAATLPALKARIPTRDLPDAADGSPDASAKPPAVADGAAASAPGPVATEGPASGVIGVGAPGGSPLALFVSQLNNHVRGQWRPKEVYQRVDPRGRLAASMFFTVVDVRIRADGSLERISVQNSSGIADLDTEAVEAFKRSHTLPRPPAEVLDAAGGYALRFGFLLDVSTFHFRSQVQRTLLEGWRGSPAFNRAGDRERITLARMLLTKDGVLVKALLLGSAGIDFLDEGVLKALPPGLRFPPPPPAFVRHPGLIPVDVEFVHNVRGSNGIRMVGPRETAETK